MKGQEGTLALPDFVEGLTVSLKGSFTPNYRVEKTIAHPSER